MGLYPAFATTKEIVQSSACFVKAIFQRFLENSGWSNRAIIAVTHFASTTLASRRGMD